MGTANGSASELQFEQLFLTEKEHLEICMLSKIASLNNEPPAKALYEADKSPNFRPGHLSMRNFLRIIDPGNDTDTTLIPGAHRADEIDILGACTSISNVTSTMTIQQHNSSRQGSTQVRFDDHVIPPRFTQDPIAFLVAYLQKHNYLLPHSVMFALTLDLLKHGHAQTTLRHGSHAYKEFADFATAIALDRLLARHHLATELRNFMQYMGLLESGKKLSYSGAALRGSLKSMDAAFALHDDVSVTRKFTPGQRSMIRLLVQEHIIEKEDYQKMVMWNAETRELTYKFLSAVLVKLEVALSRAKLYRPAHDTAATFSRGAFTVAIRNLRIATDLLSLFVQYFKTEIRLTLMWLAHVCKIKDYGNRRPRSPANWLAGLTDLDMDASCGWHEKFMFWLQLFANDFSAIQDSHPWAMYRHSKSRLTGHQKMLVPKAQLHLVQVESSYTSEGCFERLDDILDEVLELPEPKATLKAQLKRNEWDVIVKGPELQCTMHSEIILLSLHALTMEGMLCKSDDASPLSAKDISNCLKTRNIVIPEDVIDAFKTVGEVMTLSRRCCVVCRIVLDGVVQRQVARRKKRLARPASRGEIRPVALPPWTPRAIGEPVLRFLEETVRGMASRAHRCECEEQATPGKVYDEEVVFTDLHAAYEVSRSGRSRNDCRM